MDDKRAIEVLTSLLTKYTLSDEEQAAVREAIGVLGWTKLIEGWKERKKRRRDENFSDED
jgi:hypothetical protein